MNMFPLLVISAAIVAFFQDEIASFFSKLFSYAWVRLFLPILLASMGIQMYAKTAWILQFTQARIHAMMLFFLKLFPEGFWSVILSQCIFLFMMSSLPVWMLFFWMKKKEVDGIGFKISYTYFLCWLSLILLWVV